MEFFVILGLLTCSKLRTKPHFNASTVLVSISRFVADQGYWLVIAKFMVNLLQKHLLLQEELLETVLFWVELYSFLENVFLNIYCHHF